MPVHETIRSGRVPVRVWARALDPLARSQLENLAGLDFVHGHVAAMADAHAGRGSTIGSVLPTRDAIIPAAVGVDLGCGMVAARLDLRAEDLPDDLAPLRRAIEKTVPHGRSSGGGRNDRGAWGDTPEPMLKWWSRNGLERRHPDLLGRHPRLVGRRTNTHRHLGTLGTGNHFIELCLDEEDRTWIMLHSGSRGVGNRIGSYFIERARQDMDRQGLELPDRDLAYFREGNPHFDDYVAAVGWAQDFARANRRFMLEAVLAAVARVLGRRLRLEAKAVNCHHNYVARERHFGAEVWVTRKGAIRARAGDLGVIPGSMGARSYVVRGRGSAESLQSCSHGAGRAMSRREARRRFTASDLVRQTHGVECRKDDGVVDEIPGAYKDIDAVMTAQEDLVEVVHVLRQVVNVKG